MLRQGGFSGAVHPQNRHEFTGRHLKSHPVDGTKRRRRSFRGYFSVFKCQVLHPDDWFHVCLLALTGSLYHRYSVVFKKSTFSSRVFPTSVTQQRAGASSDSLTSDQTTSLFAGIPFPDYRFYIIPFYDSMVILYSSYDGMSIILLYLITNFSGIFDCFIESAIGGSAAN